MTRTFHKYEQFPRLCCQQGCCAARATPGNPTNVRARLPVLKPTFCHGPILFEAKIALKKSFPKNCNKIRD